VKTAAFLRPTTPRAELRFGPSLFSPVLDGVAQDTRPLDLHFEDIARLRENRWLARQPASQLADPHIGVSLTAQLASLLQVGIIVCAIFMLRGANWARIVYVVLTAFTVVGILTVSSRVPGLEFTVAHTIVKGVVLLYVLFRSEANAYFGGPQILAPAGCASGTPPKA
jgi:hypothetical protein